MSVITGVGVEVYDGLDVGEIDWWVGEGGLGVLKGFRD